MKKKSEKTLCDRCEELDGKCNIRNTSPWCCTKRIDAFNVIEPYALEMINELVNGKHIDRRNDDFIVGNLTNEILDYLEKYIGVMFYAPEDKKAKIIRKDFTANWMFEEKVDWESRVKKSWKGK